jgi:hypothetical protein
MIKYILNFGVNRKEKFRYVLFNFKSLSKRIYNR